MAAGQVQNPVPKANPITAEEVAIQAFIPLVTWRETSLLSWKSPQVEVSIGEGSGQYASPFSITSKDFTEKCQCFGFSPKLLQRLQDNASLFEHVFHFPEHSSAVTSSCQVDIPTHLEIFMASYENDAFFCLFRYDMKMKIAKCLLFVKLGDYSERRLMRISEVQEWLESHKQTMDRHPLMILNAILGVMQSRAHEYLEWRIKLNNMESQLGVTKYAEALRKGRYEEISHDFELLNADIAGLSKRAADNALSASTILEHAKALQRLLAICEEYEVPVGENQHHTRAKITSEQHEETQSTITRAELYLQFTKMTQAVLQSQTAILYNRINKRDSQSMKTIAVVTLFFLPATFVSAVFASGVFNFHASELANNPHTISKYGWVYLLVCLLATACTLVLWLVWYVWGHKVFETSRLSRLGQRGKLTSASADARTKAKPKNLVQRLRTRLQTLSGDTGDTPGG
jgi:CorA-like Mg2+ transporter protein